MNEEIQKTTQEFLYNENYQINIEPNSNISLGDLKNIIKQPISTNTWNLLNLMGKDAIKFLSQENDKEFQKTYITGMINKIIEVADLVDINTYEIKMIREKIQENGFENVSIDLINQVYSTLFEKIEKIKPEISTSQINNKYYTSEISYTKCVTDSKIIIIDSENNKTIVDKNKLLKEFSGNYKKDLWTEISTLPAEVILDLAVEVTFANKILPEDAGGGFHNELDIISIKDISANTIVHELGHAIDHKTTKKQKVINEININNFIIWQSFSKDFLDVFQNELTAFENAGNKRYSLDSEHTHTIKLENKPNSISELFNRSTYATLSPQEMFAECYTLMMRGSCNSEKVISKYFPKTMNCVLEIIEKTRNLPAQQRHIK